MKTALLSLVFGLIVSITGTTVKAQSKWEMDVSHSSVGFAVDHMAFSETTGKFKKFSGSFTTPDDNFNSISGTVTIQVESIDTDNADRDKHLRSADFFESDKYPTITFAAKSIKKSGKNVTIGGDLTMKGVTKPVSLTGQFKGVGKGAFGGTIAGFFRLETKVNRKDYGLTWNKALEAGGFLVGEEVRIVISSELTKK